MHPSSGPLTGPVPYQSRGRLPHGYVQGHRQGRGRTREAVPAARRYPTHGTVTQTRRPVGGA
eukprot:3999407-Alexandrium_andersonii.AAC.1